LYVILLRLSAAQVFKRFNINLPENQLRSLMQEFDTDGSGRIDFHEFIDVVLQVASARHQDVCQCFC
jgi:Ca2+-binding EF-hand superfamily protein